MDVSASAPMTVLVGGVVAMYATTGVVGVPLSFLVLAAALAVLSTGYVAMSRRVPHAAPFFAVLTDGLGRVAGIVGAAVALLGYNAIQVSLYGLLGATVAGVFGGTWWLWSLAAWGVIGAMGVLRIRIGAGVIAALMLTELAVLVVLDLGAFTHPAGGHVSLEPLLPGRLFINGLGGVLAFATAAFVGYESGCAYGEEAREGRSAGRATMVALLFLGPFYALAAWALAVAVGPDQIVTATREDPGLPFTVLTNTVGVIGPLVAMLATGLLMTSVFAAMLSFHSTVARYLFALAREGALPGRWARTGRGSTQDAPVVGSLVQSVIAAVGVVPFVVLGADPVAVLFTWPATVAALAVLVLLLASSIAALRFFRGAAAVGESVWTRRVAPTAGVVVGVVAVGVIVTNLGTLLSVPSGSSRALLIPMVVGGAVVAGLVWAVGLRVARPKAYERVGQARPHPLATPDARLDTVRL